MKTGTAYRAGPRTFATVEMVHTWRKVVFISGHLKGRFVFVYGRNDPEKIAKSAYDYLRELDTRTYAVVDNIRQLSRVHPT